MRAIFEIFTNQKALPPKKESSHWEPDYGACWDMVSYDQIVVYGGPTLSQIGFPKSIPIAEVATAEYVARLLSIYEQSLSICEQDRNEWEKVVEQEKRVLERADRQSPYPVVSWSGVVPMGVIFHDAWFSPAFKSRYDPQGVIPPSVYFADFFIPNLLPIPNAQWSLGDLDEECFFKLAYTVNRRTDHLSPESSLKIPFPPNLTNGIFVKIPYKTETGDLSELVVVIINQPERINPALYESTRQKLAPFGKDIIFLIQSTVSDELAPIVPLEDHYSHIGARELAYQPRTFTVEDIHTQMAGVFLS